MESESSKLIEQLRQKHENPADSNNRKKESLESLQMRLKTLLVALFSISMSACAFATQSVETEVADEDISQKLSNISFARRLTKPTIRMLVGYGKLSAFVTTITSLMLLLAVMSKQSWWSRGARWLAAPAMLVAALEATSDASEAMLSALLQGSHNPHKIFWQTLSATILVTLEILVWYFIAKFFEHNPPPQEDGEKVIQNTNNAPSSL